ncbi:MAG: GPR endopeptidase [Clostridia bacterium]|nr:GPR endopeptidase [Clostridia bacterium]
MERSFYNEDGFFTDLAIERRRAPLDTEGVEMKKSYSGDLIWERIRITSEEGAKAIGRPIGSYDTLTCPRMDKLSDEEMLDLSNELARELCETVEALGIIPERLLAVGLGNAALTPDSIGPRAADMINATLHIRDSDRSFFSELECSEIAVLSPGVAAKSGMNSEDIITAVCERLMPDAVIAIDSLASRSETRLGTTFQVSDTGIIPGSGIGSKRAPLNERTLGCPVIAIGVPTVISAAYLTGGRRELSDMFVSPREIDGIAENAAKIISMAVNQAFGVI